MNILSYLGAQDFQKDRHAVDTFSYQEVIERMYAYQACLRDLPKQARVCVVLPRSLDWIAAAMACWSSGYIFVPIDPDQDIERRHLLLQLARPDRVISMVYHQDFLCQTPPVPWGGIAIPYTPPHPNDIAYLCFTSGSTGVPKGVLVSFAGLGPMLQAQRKAFGIGPYHHTLWALSPGFDASFSDVFVPLIAGACLHIAPAKLLSDPQKTLEFIKDRGITHADLPPAFLKLIDPVQAPVCLETVMFGGEAADVKSVQKWSQHKTLINIYGPTEATVCASLQTTSPAWSKPMLGKPIAGLTFEVFDPQTQLPSPEGELWIAGPGLAVGYWENPTATQQKFVEKDGERWYKTGDRVRKKDMVFLGRVDREIKRHGVRVSPEEAEYLLQSIPSISGACVFAYGNLLAAVIECQDDIQELAKEVLQKLHHSARPTLLAYVRTLSRLPSGKPNIEDLKSLFFTTSLPKTPEEEQLCRIVAEILHIPNVSPHDTLQGLGGDSLHLIEVLCQAQAEGLHLSTDALSQGKSFTQSLLKDEEALTVETLKEAIKPYVAFPIKGAQHQKTHDILLTGATGFLGGHLLGRLLQKGQSVVALVRARNHDHARHRLKDSLKKAGYAPDLAKEASILVGSLEELADLYQPALSVGRILHSAADVSLGKSFSSLQRSSLLGMQQVAWVCQTYNVPLTYISTLSVWAASMVQNADPDRPLSQAKALYGGYAQSKWACEALLETFPIQKHILRLPLLLAGPTGYTPPQDLFQQSITGILRIRSMPYAEKGDICCMQVHVAAACIEALLEEEGPLSHIAPLDTVSIQDLQKILHLPMEDVQTWFPKALNLHNMTALAFSRFIPEIWPKYRPFDLFAATDMILHAEKTYQILQTKGHIIPSSKDAMTRALQKDFLREI